MGVSSAIEWWDEQQLRVLVLGSLGVQYFLAFFAGRRKSRIPSWYRFCIWLSYLGSDALAIYALAALFNRQQKLQYRSSLDGRRDLEVLWAPVMLMHLGGQLVITAYNIEDNELWRRHILTALSQVTVAIYVFCKSWPSSADPRLLTAAICLFIPGVVKCIDKPLALRRASFNSIGVYSSSNWSTPSSAKEDLDEYVAEARATMVKIPSSPTGMPPDTLCPTKLFLDSASPYSHRLATLKRFRASPDNVFHWTLKYMISNMFDILYTKANKSPKHKLQFISNLVNWLLCMVLPIVAVSLFHKSHTQAYSRTDVHISIVLFYGTLLLEFISFFRMLFFLDKWSNMVAQHSLIGLLARNKRPGKLMSLVRRLPFKNHFFSMQCCNSSENITNCVRRHVLNGWKDYMTDADSYMEFNNIRGQWTLKQSGCYGSLSWSLQKPFDESVLIWHMATYFCFYLGKKHPFWKDDSRLCIEISNYMVHLLCANPEMLLPGSRKDLFKTTYDELEEILKDQECLMDEKEVVSKVIDVVKCRKGSEECSVRSAWMLAKKLIGHKGASLKMWEVIQGVWLEMICFSAGRCRGFLHAKSLGTSGEYLSIVWLLLANSGMETFQDKLRRTEKLERLEDYKVDTETEEDISDSQGTELRSMEDQIVAGDSQGEGTSPELTEIVMSP